MKKTIKLSRKELTDYITESVRKIIKEGTNDTVLYDEWERLRETMGDAQMLDELFEYLSADQIQDFVETTKGLYDSTKDSHQPQQRS